MSAVAGPVLGVRGKMRLKRKLMDLCRKRGISKNTLRMELGIPVSAFYRIFNNKLRISDATLRKVCTGLDWEPEKFYDMRRKRPLLRAVEFAGGIRGLVDSIPVVIHYLLNHGLRVEMSGWLKTRDSEPPSVVINAGSLITIMLRPGRAGVLMFVSAPFGGDRMNFGCMLSFQAMKKAAQAAIAGDKILLNARQQGGIREDGLREKTGPVGGSQGAERTGGGAAEGPAAPAGSFNAHGFFRTILETKS